MDPKNPDYQRAVETIVAIAPFIQEVAIRLDAVGAGWCDMSIALETKHLQQDGYVHAGALMTLADHTAGCAATSLVAADEYVLSAEFNISMLHAAKGETLQCRAEVIKPGRRLIVAESSVYACANGQRKLVAKARVTLAVLQRMVDR